MPLSPRRVLRTFRYALYFDGVDDHVRVPNNPSLVIRNEITVIAWAMYYPIGRYTTIVGKGTHNRGFALAVDIYRRVFFGVCNDPSGARWWVVDGVMSGVMSFYAGVSKLGYTAFYVNDRLYGPLSNTYPPFIDNPYDLYVGGRGFWSPAGFYQGYISVAMLYSRALSESEIMFNYINPDNPVRNGLVLWLKADPAYIRDIDGDGVPEWLDLSGFNNHGKIYGARLEELIRTPTRALTAVRTLTTVR